MLTWIRLLLIFNLFLLCQCQRSTEPRKQDKSPLEEVTELSIDQQLETKSLELYNKFSPDFQEVSKQLEINSVDSLTKSLNLLRPWLFEYPQKRLETYSLNKHSAAVALFWEVIRRSGEFKTSTGFQTQLNQDLDQFEKIYIKNCLKEERGTCEPYFPAMKLDTKSVNIVLHLEQRLSDFSLKIDYLGFAFDMLAGESHIGLLRRYQDLLIDRLSTDQEEMIKTLGNKRFYFHIRAVQQLLNFENWTLVDETKIATFEKLQPWKAFDQDDILFALRSSLLPYLPIYMEQSEKVNQGLLDLVDQEIKTKVVKAINLETYPAYKNIKIDQFLKDSPLVTYVVWSLYFGAISQPVANEIFRWAPDKKTFIAEYWNKTRLLIRWDMAQMGIQSTQFIADLLRKRPNFNADGLQIIINDTSELSPMWNSFHSTKAPALKGFLETHWKENPDLDYLKFSKFFKSFDRNIMKTVIYPNMLAVFFRAQQNQVDGRVLVPVRPQYYETINYKTIFDELLTSKIKVPWFAFVDLNNGINYGRQILVQQLGLYPTEILDSFYYFLSTKTIDEYNINIDQFLLRLSQNLLESRKNHYSDAIDAQLKVYWKNQEPNEFLKWCQAIEKGEFLPEKYEFLRISSFITPFSWQTADTYKSKRYYTKKAPFYFEDSYQNYESFDGVSNKAGILNDLLDRYRLELVPILKTLNLYTHTYEKTLDRYKLPKNDLKRTKEYVSRIDKLSKAFIGNQVHLARTFFKCNQIAAKESRRRIKAFTEAETQYLEDFLYPLMVEVRDNKRSIIDANRVLKEFHNNNPAYLDRIFRDSAGDVGVHFYKSTMMSRVSYYFTQGVEFHKEGFDISIDPVIEGSEPIEIPEEFRTEPSKNKYFETKVNYPDIAQTDTISVGMLNILADESVRKFFRVKANTTAQDFSSSVIGQVTDTVRSNVTSKKFTSWDWSDTKTYEFSIRKPMDIFLTFYQLGEIEHYDMSKPECHRYQLVDYKDCKSHSQITTKDLGDLMSVFFNVIDLDDEELSYMKNIGESGYASLTYMVSLFKRDSNLLKNNTSAREGYYVFDRLSGFFDYAYKLANEDLLGTILSITHVSGFKVSGCSKNYRECPWTYERTRANDFYNARLVENNFYLFDFDEGLLKHYYGQAKNEILSKLNAPENIKNEAPKELARYMDTRDGEPLRVNDLEDELYTLVPISREITNKRNPKDKFLIEDTRSLFIDEPNWQDYLRWAQ